MDIGLKHKIAEKIIQIYDDNLLNEIKSLVGLPEGDFWSELPGNVKFAINEAKIELDNGAGIPHSVIMEEVQNRFQR